MSHVAAVRRDLLLVASMFIWATVYPATKSIADELHPLEIAFFRYLFGTLPLIPFLFLKENRPKAIVILGDIWKMAALGVLGVTLFSIFLVYGIRLSTAYNGSLLTNTQPIFTALIAPILINEKFSLRRLIGTFGGLCGIYLIMSEGRSLAEMLRHDYFFGNILLVAGSIVISVYNIFLKRFVSQYGVIIPTFYSMATGTILLFILLVSQKGGLALRSVTIHHWLLLLYIGIVGTALVYPLFNRALYVVGVVRAVGFKLLIPLFGILLSVFLLNERLGYVTFLGAGLVVGSVYLIQHTPSNRNYTCKPS